MPEKMLSTVLTNAEKLEHIRKYPLPSWCNPLWVVKTKPRQSKSYRCLFERSVEWKALRQQVLNHYGCICMRCKSTCNIQVDHIKPKSKYPQLALDFNNLQVLCWNCNKKKSCISEIDYR